MAVDQQQRDPTGLWPLQAGGAQVASYWIAAAVPMAVSLVGVAVFTRLVNVNDYGRFVLVTAVTGIIITALAGWGEYAVLRMVPEVQHPAGLATVISAVRRVVMRTSVLAAGGLLLAGLAAIHVAWLPVAFLPYVFPAGCSLLVRPTYQVMRTVYQARGEAQRYAAYEVAQAVLIVVLGVLVVWLLRLGMFGRLWVEVVVLAFLILVANRSLSGHAGTTSGREGTGENDTIRRARRLGLPVVGWFTGLSLMAGLERSILRGFAGDGAVGSYGAIFALIERASTLAFGPLLMSSFPHIVKVFASHGGIMAGIALGRAIAVFGVVAAVYLVLGFGFAKTVVGVIVPGTYLAGLDVVPWLLVAFAVWHFAMYAHKGLELAERVWSMLAAMGVALGTLGLACFVLVPRFGIMGVGAARVLASLAYLIVVLRSSHVLAPWAFKLAPSDRRLP